jgi:hypothetical protein
LPANFSVTPQDDPRTVDMSDNQLTEELAALQAYNLRAFRRLGELAEAEAQLRMQLNRSTGGSVR